MPTEAGYADGGRLMPTEAGLCRRRQARDKVGGLRGKQSVDARGIMRTGSADKGLSGRQAERTGSSFVDCRMGRLGWEQVGQVGN
jgi:hypothetical protein